MPYRFIDNDGNFIGGEYETASSFAEGLAAVKRDGKWGYADRDGQIVIAPAYDLAGNFGEGLAPVYRGPVVWSGEHDGKWGFIDRSGALVIDFQYGMASRFAGGLAPVNVGGFCHIYTAGGGAWGYIDRSGAMAIAPRYDHAGWFTEGVAWVHDSDGWRGIDARGDVSVTPTGAAGAAAHFAPFADGMAYFSLETASGNIGKYGYVDRSGKTVLEPIYGDAGYFGEGLAAVNAGGHFRRGSTVGGGFGFIDRTGAFVIAPAYRGGGVFSGGLAAVRVGSDWGYIRRDGSLAIAPQFDFAAVFAEGRAAVDVKAPKAQKRARKKKP